MGKAHSCRDSSHLRDRVLRREDAAGHIKEKVSPTGTLAEGLFHYLSGPSITKILEASILMSEQVVPRELRGKSCKQEFHENKVSKKTPGS